MTCGTHLATFPARALKFPDRAAKFPVPGENIPCSAASGILLQAIGFPRRLVAKIAEKGPKLKNSLLNSLFSGNLVSRPFASVCPKREAAVKDRHHAKPLGERARIELGKENQSDPDAEHAGREEP